MKIKKTTLLPALQKLAKITTGESKSATPVTRCVMLSAANGLLKLSATSGSQYSVEIVECSGDLERTLIPLKSLLPVVTHGDDEQEYTLNDKGRLAYNVGTKGSLATTAEDFPEPPQEMKPVAVNPTDLAKGVHAVKWAMSDDPTRMSLNAVHIELSAQKIFCAATVGTYFAFHTQKAIAGELALNVYREFVNGFEESLVSGAQLVVSESWAGVTSEKSQYYFKLVEDSYPPTDKLLAAKRNEVGIVDVEQWSRVFSLIQDLRGVTEKQMAKVMVALRPKCCEIEYENGDATVSKKIDGKFVPTELTINAATFTKCLGAFPDGSNPKLLMVDNGTERNPVVIEDGDLLVMTTQIIKGV